MTPAELDAIRQRFARGDTTFIPALIAEVERLRAARVIGYREGRLEAWSELVEWAEQNLDIAKDVLTERARAVLEAGDAA